MARPSSRGAEPPLDTIRRVYRTWGQHPRLYAAQDWVTFLARHRAIRRAAVDAAGLRPGQRALEIGCGTGRNLGYLQARVGPTGEIVAFDYSADMLDAARALSRARGWENVRFVQGDAAALEVGDAPFDAVVSVLALSVVPDYERALERSRAVLRPGGVLSVCDGRLFGRRLAWLNPLLRRIYTGPTAWDPDRDLAAAMRRVFGFVSVRTFNAGTLFIATARKPEGPAPSRVARDARTYGPGAGDD